MLFAAVPEETNAAAASLFSDNNPFRRKSQQPSLVLESIEQTQIPNNGESVNRDSCEEKKYDITMEEGEEGEERKVQGKGKTRHNPADIMVSKEGFDDEDKLLRTVFVGNLPLKVKKKTLLKEFKNFGEVKSVRIRSVPIQDKKKELRKGGILVMFSGC